MSSFRRRTPTEGSRMRMDRRPNATRISDPSHPAGKRREIDNVMKKARQQPTNEYWDKKILEVEDKDPNRWKHSGYAKIYNVNSGNGSRRSRSRSPVRRTPVSPQRSRHLPPTRGGSRTPERYRPRSPPPHYSSRERMIKTKEIVRPTKSSRPMSPPIHHKQSARTPSASSYSDESCSVYSSDEGGRKSRKTRPRPLERYPGPVNRIRSISPQEERIAKKKPKTISPKRRLKRPASPSEKPSRRQELESPRAKKKDKTDKLRTRIKIEGEKRRRTPSSASDDSSADEYTFPALTATTRITLSERFGKIAQWSNDRKYDMSNMKITKDSVGGDRSAVMISEQQIRDSPPARSQFAGGPDGHYPEELMPHSSAQAMGMNWDDIRVRFDYYKSKGYLRDLTLHDYQAWEAWWYRYQAWLKQERYFENMGRNMMRRRRKKIPIQQRLN